MIGQCGQASSSPSASSAAKMPSWWLLAIQELLVVTEPEHEGNGPKMLEIAKKRCGEACPDIDLASDRAFGDAKAFQDKYWRGTHMNDDDKRRRWKTKLNDWQDTSRDPPTRPGYKTQMLGELRAAVGADILPFVAFPTDDSLTLFDHTEHVQQQNQQVGWTGGRERP